LTSFAMDNTTSSALSPDTGGAWLDIQINACLSTQHSMLPT